LWVGLLYDGAAREAAWDEVKHWTLDERQTLRDAVPREGLTAITPGGESLRDFGRRILAISEAGLATRARLNGAGDSETGFLDPLREIIATGEAPADRLLRRYREDWGGDIRHIYEEESF